MAQETVLPLVVTEKLAAFERLQPEFEASFRSIEAVQGQQRFLAFPIVDTVQYLHALWMCDCKDRLLSVPRTIERYEGQRCLELLQRWQAGEVTEVVEFLQRKLDSQPFSILTRQIEQLQRQDDEAALIERLRHGRLILLNRAMNLMQALEPIFTLPPQQMLADVQAACALYHHRPEEIARQLAALKTASYAPVPHPALARKNMLLMNKMGVQEMAGAVEQPGQRFANAAALTMPEQPYAEEVIGRYVDMTSLQYNNLSGHRFVTLSPAISAFTPDQARLS